MSNFNREAINETKRDYFIIAWMVIAHLVALLGPIYFSWGAVALCTVFYFLTGCLGITLCFHRMLTHRSFKANKWVERFIATCGTLALQGSPLEWVAHHRMHHAGSDTDMDPHNASRGFWYSHIGWLFAKTPKFDDPSRLNKFGRDILADPYLVWLSHPVTMIGLQVGLGLLFLAWGGGSYVVWGIFIRLVLVYHTTWFVNSASHMWGYKNYDTADLATNNWWVGILAFGEGWHNNHHAEPEAAHVHRKFWEFDLTWQIIKLLRTFGLAWDIKYPSIEPNLKKL